MRYKQILNIEQFDEIEEQLGIALRGIAAEISEESDDGTRLILARGEIISLTDGKLEQNIRINFSAFDSSQQCIASDHQNFFKKYFIGIHIFRLERWVRTKDIDKVIVLPEIDLRWHY